MVAAMFPDRDTHGDPPGPSSSSQDHGYVTPQTEQLFMLRAQSEDAEVQRQQHYTKEHLRIAEIHNNRGKPQWKQEDWTSYDDSSRQDTWQQSSSSSGVAREPDGSIPVMHMPPRYHGEWKDDGWQHDEWQEEQAPWLSGKKGKQKGKRQHSEQDWNRPQQGKGKKKGRSSQYTQQVLHNPHDRKSVTVLHNPHDRKHTWRTTIGKHTTGPMSQILEDERQTKRKARRGMTKSRTDNRSAESQTKRYDRREVVRKAETERAKTKCTCIDH